MPHIRVIPEDEAGPQLAAQYRAAYERAGRVWNIVSIMSQSPRTMQASMDVYSSVMFGSSPLSRGQREMLAVVTSAANGCVY